MKQFLAAVFACIVLCGSGLSASAAEHLYMSGGREVRKMSRQDCALKAIEGMTTKAGFPYAEKMEDGNVRGHNAKVTVMVLSYPTPDPERIMIAVVAAGEKEELERVFGIVRTHVYDGTVNPATPTRVVPADGKVPPALTTLCYKSEDRGAISILKLFEPAVMITFEKKGYGSKSGNGITIGIGESGTMMMAFLTTTSNVQSARINVISSSLSQQPAETATKDVLATIIKTLYE